MAIDWKAEISRIVYWKQLAAEHDKKKALPWHLPRVGAKPSTIDAAERAAGIVFPAQYKEFLGYADGWQGFHVCTDLFGTKEFLEGKPKAVINRPELLVFLESNKFTEKDVVPIGASEHDIDVFLLVSPTSKMFPSGVLWFASEEVDRYQSFAEFFGAMVNYNARVAQKMVENG